MIQVWDAVSEWLRGREDDIKIVNDIFRKLLESPGYHAISAELTTGAKLYADTDYRVRIYLPESIQVPMVTPGTFEYMTSHLTAEDKATATKTVEEAYAARCGSYTIPLSHEIIIVSRGQFTSIANI